MYGHVVVMKIEKIGERKGIQKVTEARAQRGHTACGDRVFTAPGCRIMTVSAVLHKYDPERTGERTGNGETEIVNGDMNWASQIPLEYVLE